LIECASSALSHPSMQHLSKGIIPLVWNLTYNLTCALSRSHRMTPATGWRHKNYHAAIGWRQPLADVTKNPFYDVSHWLTSQKTLFMTSANGWRHEKNVTKNFFYDVRRHEASIMSETSQDIMFLVHNKHLHVESTRVTKANVAQWRSAASMHIAGATVQGSDIESSYRYHSLQ
jgi:hypothetical protein